MEEITEVTSNHFGVKDLSSKTQRGISLYDLALFARNFRLVIRVQVFLFVLNCLVGTTRENPLGNGITTQNGSKLGHNRVIWQGKVGKSTGCSIFNAWERWNGLRNPIKHRETKNLSLIFSGKTHKLFQASDKGYI